MGVAPAILGGASPVPLEVFAGAGDPGGALVRKLQYANPPRTAPATASNANPNDRDIVTSMLIQEADRFRPRL
jgi:hypothetical protein